MVSLKDFNTDVCLFFTDLRTLSCILNYIIPWLLTGMNYHELSTFQLELHSTTNFISV